MKRTLNAVRAVLVAAPMMLGAVAAQAVLVSDGTTQSFSWSFATPTNPSRNLTGTGSFSLTGFNSNSLTMTVTLNNTAPTLGQGGDRLTAWGFGISPEATTVSLSDVSDAGMINAELSFIPSLKEIEVCAFGGPNNCQGGGQGGDAGGIFAGASDTFSLLIGGSWGASVTIEPIGFKYQTGTGSYEFFSSSSSSSSTSGSGITSGPAPEPGSAALALLGLGLLGAGYKLRRRATGA
jgi:hypothetical protein